MLTHVYRSQLMSCGSLLNSKFESKARCFCFANFSVMAMAICASNAKGTGQSVNAAASFRVDQTVERPYRQNEDAPPPSARSTTEVSFSRLQLSGNPKPQISWNLRLNPGAELQKDQCISNANGDLKRKQGCDQKFVETVAIQLAPEEHPWLIASAGLMDVEIGGWELAMADQEELFPSDYLISQMPFSRQQPVIGFSTSGHNHFGIQLTNDTTTAFGEKGQFSNRRTQPVSIIYWDSHFYGIKPKVQMSSYDQNRSIILSFGAMVERPSAPMTFSYNSTLDRRVFRLPDLEAPGTFRRKAGTYYSQMVDLRVDVTDQVRFIAKGSFVKLFDCHCTKDPLPEMELQHSWMIGASQSLSGESLRAFAAIGALDKKSGENEELSRLENDVDSLTFRLGVMGKL